MSLSTTVDSSSFEAFGFSLHDWFHLKNVWCLGGFDYYYYFWIIWDLFVVIDLVYHLKKWNRSGRNLYEFINWFQGFGINPLYSTFSLLRMTTRIFLNFYFSFGFLALTNIFFGFSILWKWFLRDWCCDLCMAICETKLALIYILRLLSFILEVNLKKTTTDCNIRVSARTSIHNY